MEHPIAPWCPFGHFTGVELNRSAVEEKANIVFDLALLLHSSPRITEECFDLVRKLGPEELNAVCSVKDVTFAALSPLQIAVAFGDNKFVELLIAQSANVNFYRGDAPPPLIMACRHNTSCIASSLIVHGANVDRMPDGAARQNGLPDGATPLCLAAEIGNTKIVRLLLFVKASLEPTTSDKSTCVHFAASCTGAAEARDKCMRLLLEDRGDMDARRYDEATPLLLASQRGNESTCRLLLNWKADITAVDASGNNCLHMLADSESCTKDCARLLLLARCSLADKNKFGKTPLLIATACGNMAMASMIMAYRGDCTVDWKDSEGETPLLRACSLQDDSKALEMALLLIKYGADVDLENRYHLHPAVVASRRKHDTLLRLLAETGFDEVKVQKSYSFHRTPDSVDPCTLQRKMDCDLHCVMQICADFGNFGGRSVGSESVSTFFDLHGVSVTLSAGTYRDFLSHLKQLREEKYKCKSTSVVIVPLSTLVVRLAGECYICFPGSLCAEEHFFKTTFSFTHFGDVLDAIPAKKLVILSCAVVDVHRVRLPDGSFRYEDVLSDHVIGEGARTIPMLASKDVEALANKRNVMLMTIDDFHGCLSSVVDALMVGGKVDNKYASVHDLLHNLGSDSVKVHSAKSHNFPVCINPQYWVARC
eukprot:GEMP01012849.1.p1 GENE.GEMP01012849.1~~GEMP01012849.1.p1  ORF type:complete len:652 (+),score=131.98 GEMP01012849.1:129-2084(+)